MMMKAVKKMKASEEEDEIDGEVLNRVLGEASLRK